ncbi:MAG: response regulator transcription factor [Elusimicrobia bacterium]|nr:response regulator transcription factor [Elusimicrobiota bacterium]
MIKILIADDHIIIRKGLKQILSEDPSLIVAGEAANGHEVMEKLKAKHWDVIVLDSSLPDRSVLEILKQIKSHHPKIPIVVFTMNSEEHYAVRVLKAGASGFITKDAPPDQLISAIQKVARGGRYVSPAFAERLAFNLVSGVPKPLHETLSDREFQVMCMISSGKTITEIAEQLFLSVKTVSTHRSRILEKMKMKNNAELIIYAIQNGLVNGAVKRSDDETESAIIKQTA